MNYAINKSGEVPDTLNLTNAPYAVARFWLREAFVYGAEISARPKKPANCLTHHAAGYRRV